MSNILKHLKKQKEIEGDSESLQDVHEIYNMLSKLDDGRIWSSKWSVLIRVEFHKYGSFSYQSHRFYYPSDIYLAMKEMFKDENEKC